MYVVTGHEAPQISPDEGAPWSRRTLSGQFPIPCVRLQYFTNE